MTPELDRSMYGSARIPSWKVGQSVIPNNRPRGTTEWTVAETDGVFLLLRHEDGRQIKRRVGQVSAPTGRS